MQVDPMIPNLKPPGTKRLKLNYNNLLSSFAFNPNLRRYMEGEAMRGADGGEASTGIVGRGLHSSTSQLNLSRV